MYAIPIFEVRRTGSLCVPVFQAISFMLYCFPKRFTSHILNRISYSNTTHLWHAERAWVLFDARGSNLMQCVNSQTHNWLSYFYTIDHIIIYMTITITSSSWPPCVMLSSIALDSSLIRSLYILTKAGTVVHSAGAEIRHE